MRFILNLLATIAILTGPAIAGKGFKELSTYQILADEFRPYNYIEDGKNIGINTEILQVLIKKFKIKLSTENIKFAPWPATYEKALKGENVILMSVAKSESRDPLFKWVGPVINNDIVMVAKKGSEVKSIDMQNLEDCKIGVVNNDIANIIATKFVSKKFLNLSDTAQQLIKKLNDKRLDFVIYDKKSFFNYVEDLGLNIDDYEIVKTFEHVGQYFAFSNNTSDELISKMQEYLDYYKLGNKYQDLLKKYNLQN